jgi:hypothetical protein
LIYFIKDVAGGRIKIGTTIQLSERLKQLAAETGGELTVLAVVAGSHEEERRLHRRFAHLCKTGEWFEPGDDLLGFIVEEGRPWDGTDEVWKLSPVKLHADAIKLARIASAYRGQTMTDMLSDILRPILEEIIAEEVIKQVKPPKGKGGPK